MKAWQTLLQGHNLIFSFKSLGLVPSSLHSTLGVHLSLPPPSRVVLTRIWWWGTTRGALVFLFSDFVCALVCVVQVLRFLFIFFFFLMLIREQNPNFGKQYLIFKKWSGCDPALKLLVLKSPWMSCKQSYCRDMALKLTMGGIWDGNPRNGYAYVEWMNLGICILG